MSDRAPRLDLPALLRRHGTRAPGMMWFLGAGASATAGIPTAEQMVWEFKRAVFCAEERVPLAACEELNDPVVRSRIQRHFSSGAHPRAGAPEEYAHYFELAWSDEADRRRYIERKIRGASPSFGHSALATLLHAQQARIIWTTNFDSCIETRCARSFDDAGRLTTVPLDAPELAEQALNEDRWPLLVKLHGDFRSRRLKNTSDELRSQDGRLRDALTAACGRYGLIVVGYSGRDDSVMDALLAAAVEGGYPGGLFWVHSGDSEPMPRCLELIERAAACGIDAAVVAAETFDEFLGDVVRQTPDIPASMMKELEPQAPRLGAAPLPSAGTGWPVVRTNALAITDFPTLCRRIEASIGGARQLRQAVAAAGVKAELIAARANAGVLAFGSDDALLKALAGHEPAHSDLHPIDPERLAWESAEHGLLAEALARALARDSPLLVRRRHRRWVLVVDPEQRKHPNLSNLADTTSGILGRLPSGNGFWGEAVELRLDQRLDRLWLLLGPAIWLTASPGPRPACDMDFVRERQARRYNAQFNQLLMAWIRLLLGDEDVVRIAAFGGVDGIDAAFTVPAITGFSRPARSEAAREERAA